MTAIENLELIEKIYFYLSIGISVLAFLTTARAEKKASSEIIATPKKMSQGLFLSAIVGLTLFRFYIVQGAFGGVFTAPDENAMSRIYTFAILSKKPIFGGVTQAFAAILYGLWYKIFGCCAVTSTRYLSTTLGTFALAATYILAKREFGKSIACLTVLFLSFSAFLELFSTLAVETISVFLFVPLVLLILSLKQTYRSFAFSLFAGVMIALSLFTYPGVGLYLFSLALAFFLIGPKKCMGYFLRGDVVLSSLAAASTVGTALYFHFSVYSSKNREIFLGAGGLPTHPWQILDAFLSNLIDLFHGGNSIYFRLLPYGSILEPCLWGFFLLGIYYSLKSKDRRLTPIFLSILICFCLNIFITSEPGLRRILGILPAAYILCAFGCMKFWSSTRRLVGGSFLCLAINFFWIVPQNISAAWLTNTPAIPDELILSSLEKGDVYLDRNEFDHDSSSLEPDAARALSDMTRLFHPHPGQGNVILFTENHFPPLLSSSNCGVFFYWENFRKNLSPDFWPSHGLTVRGRTQVKFQGKVLNQVFLSKNAATSSRGGPPCSI